MHKISEEDIEFKRQVESYEYPVPDFDHKSHVRLAYVYLIDNNVESAVVLMRKALMGLLLHAGIEPSKKYHETITEAWVMAVSHFMNESESSGSAAEFIQNNTKLLDTQIMLTHYSAEVLYSEKARQSFLEPNLEPIPRH